jgi:hypothetical protein
MYAIGRWALLTCLMKSSTKSELMFAPLLYIYREVKQRIFRENRQAKVIFLECPFLSVYRWNKHQGREYNTQTEEIEKKQDTELKSIAKYFNDQLQLINRDWTTPKISVKAASLLISLVVYFLTFKIDINGFYIEYYYNVTIIYGCTSIYMYE